MNFYIKNVYLKDKPDEEKQAAYSWKLLVYCGVYAVAWTLLAALLDPAVPYDAIEALNWATNGEWGSPKNPWLVGMIYRPVLNASPTILSIYWYLSHFAAVAVGLLGVWKLAYRLSRSIWLAWLAILILNLSGIINFDIIPYNDNYLLVALWPWMFLWGLRALFDHPRYWIAFSGAAGLASMAKYSTLAFVGTLLLLMVIVPSLRRHWSCRWFYAGLLFGLLLVFPNIIWLWQHQFAAFKWVGSQITQQLNSRALKAAILIFYPIILAVILLQRFGAKLSWPERLEQRLSVLWLLIPVTVILLYFTLYQGGRITEWLQPFVVLAPALLVSYYKVQNPYVLRSLLRGLFGVAWLVWLGYGFIMSTNVRNAGQKFIGIKAFSATLQRHWQQRYATRLSYVGGHSLAEWLTFYAVDRPEVINTWSNQQLPNIYNSKITYEKLRQKGVLLISKPGVTHCQADYFIKPLSHWPELVLTDMLEIEFIASPANSPQQLCIGFIAPSEK